MLFRQFLCLALIFTMIHCATDWSKLNELIQDAIINRAFPGATIVVANQSAILFKKNYGNLQYTYQFHDIEVTNETKYDVASITKVMATTWAIMNLASSNNIKLDDLVTKYITNYDTNKKGNTTIANLLLHNSGLPYDYPGPLPKTTQEVLQYITFAKPAFPVGTKFQYSNLGFLLLGEIVAKISKKTLSQYFDQNKVFAGLRDSTFNPPANETYKIAPTEYDAGRYLYIKETRLKIIRGEAHERLAYFFKGVAGHSGLFTTADDLIRFMRIILCKGKLPNQSKILSDLLVSQYTTRVTGLPYENTRTYGFDTDCPGSKMNNCVGHDGSTGIMAWADKDKKIAFVLMNNRGHPDVKNSLIDEYKPKIADAIFTALGY